MHSILLVLLILLIAVAAFYLIDRVGFPSPFHWIAKAFVLVIAMWQLLLAVGISLPV